MGEFLAICGGLAIVAYSILYGAGGKAKSTKNMIIANLLYFGGIAMLLTGLILLQ